MAIISTIGRKSLKVRLLIGTIYAGLSIGALTMLYPFCLMLAGSTKSAVDSPDAHIIPPFLRSELALYQKYMETQFNEAFSVMKATYGMEATSFRDVKPPETINPRLTGIWETFCREANLPFYCFDVGELYVKDSRGVLPRRLRMFKRQMIERFNNDIDALNGELGMNFVSWNNFNAPVQPLDLRFRKASLTPFASVQRGFAAAQPIGVRYYVSLEGVYLHNFLMLRYGKSIESYNASHKTAYAGWDQVHLDRRLPDGNGRSQLERDDWESFVRGIVNLLWVRCDKTAAPAYHAYLKAKYDTIAILNKRYETAYSDFGEIPLVEEPALAGLVQADWAGFVEGWKDPQTDVLHQAPLQSLRIHSVDFIFRDWLQARHGTIADFNAKAGTSFSDWLAIRPPQQDLHYQYFKAHTGELRREFTVRNFISVFDYIVMHGRGILNTIIYCSLAILAALTINPLAAYALSRYKPPSSYKVLLVLMMTMAFPPMVTQIPVFLMLRDLHLLNSFWALILPGLANGYSIFLLKGFFDSLPQELYESAAIDGAGEFRIFFQITMSLSKPILAVIALNTFTLAYGNFMMALLICQDEKMWPLMPWLYQLQQRSTTGVVMASLLVAAVPTFVIFSLCQNIIMRGIVVPVEK